MGLRIHSNIPALIALRNLNLADGRRQVAYERLATGFRINRAGDDPTGIAMSESYRSEIRSLQQAARNNSDSDNLLTTADAALGEVTTLLSQIQASLVFAMGSSATPEEIQAEQDFVDGALDAIDRIAATTRFGEISLLNGRSGFAVQNVNASIRSVQPMQVRFNPVTDPTAFSLDVTTAAEQATFAIGSGVVGGDATLTVAGPRGSIALQFSAGATAADVAAAIDNARGHTGLFTVGTTVFSEEFGSEKSIRLTNSAGTGTVAGIAPGATAEDFGVDAAATFDGASVTARGNVFALNSPAFRGSVELQPGTAVGTYGWEIRNSGLLLQVGPRATSANQMTVGISSVAASSLGASAITIAGETFDGFLSSLATGSANDLFTNPRNASRIVSRAVDQINAIRSGLGAVVSQVVQPAQRTQEVAIENLTAADSDLRDADFATEFAEQVRQQVLFESGLAVLGQANLVPQSVLRLLE